MSTIAQSLVAQLRRRVMDERVNRVAFRFSCIDEAATDCFVTISAANVFTVDVINGRYASSFTVDLTEPTYKNVKLLVEYLSTRPGFSTIVEQDFEGRHPSVDLEVVGTMSARSTAVTLKHHLFSDDEYLGILSDACRRHNLSYTPETVPLNEEVFVLLLAHADVCRQLASDAAKRRNIESSADQLLQVATDLETAYSRDVERQQRAIPVAQFDEGATQQGDVVVGTFARRSLRTGRFSPKANDGVFAVPVLLEPSNSSVEDTKITVQWKRNVDLRFYSYELWRDTVPDIVRPVILDPHESTLLRTVTKQPFTVKLVFRATGPSETRDRFGRVSYRAESGQLITTFVDVGVGDDPAALLGSQVHGAYAAPPVEPETLYYYRLFITSVNDEILGSNVVAFQTLSLRAFIARVNPLSITEGVAGAAVTLTGERFHAGMSVTVGGKSVGSLVVVDPNTATFTIPTFVNPAAVNQRYDVAVTSSTGLKDVLALGFRYTGS